MGWCVRSCRLLCLALRKYWIFVAWTAACSYVFYGDYSYYKKQPQYYYTRRMLGLGLCVSRGSAAVLNLSCCCVVLPMCRALTTALATVVTCHARRCASATPATLASLTDPATHTAKTTHLMIAVTLVLSSVVHSAAHLANGVNFSRHFNRHFPELNWAAYKGENPARLFVATVPGVTGVAMILTLVVMGVSSTRCFRQRHYNFFYYTHHLGLLFFLLLLLHPLSGVLKEQKNLKGHFPGCHMSSHKEEGYPEPDAGEDFKHLHNSTMLNKRTQDGDLPQPPEYGYPDPNVDAEEYGFPEPNVFEEYGFPEPNVYEEYGFPEPTVDDEEYGFPEPSVDDYGYPEPDVTFGNSLSTLEQRLHAHEGQSRNFKPLNPKFAFANKRQLGEQLSIVDKKVKAIVEKETRKPHLRRRRRKCLRPPQFEPMKSQTWIWVTVALSAWAMDWVLRWWRRREVVEVVGVVHHACDVLQLTLRKHGFSCTPGQYVLVQCPEVSKFEWHPFTVTCPPVPKSPGTFTLFMRVRGDWSRRMAAVLQPNTTCTRNTTRPVTEPQQGLHTIICCGQGSTYSPVKQASQLSHCDPHLQSSIRHQSQSFAFTDSSLPHSDTASSLHTSTEVRKNSSSCSWCNDDTSNTMSKNSRRIAASHIYPESGPHIAVAQMKFGSQCSQTLPALPNKCWRSFQVLNTLPSLTETYDKQEGNTKTFHSHPHHYRLKTSAYSHILHTFNKLQYARHGYTRDCNTCTCPQKNVHVHSPLNDKPLTTNGEVLEGMKSSFQDLKHHHHAKVPFVRLYVDGPFSSPSEGMLHYPIVVGVAGGMGITPLAAALSHILLCCSPWPQRVHVVWATRDVRLLYIFAPLLSGFLHHCWMTHAEDRVELSLHVTQPTSQQLLQDLFAVDHPALLPRIRLGRPHWKHLFHEWQCSYVGKTVGVFACGPAKLRHQVKRQCLSAVSRGASFHYHQESFS